MPNNLPRLKKVKIPWPTKAVMEQIYETNLWGGNKGSFFSGEGSHLPEIVNPYLDSIQAFLDSFTDPLTICDLGCGDFNVGKELVKHTKKYIAVDIVVALIAHNEKTFKAPNLEFHCVDIATGPLPKADCAIVRQVLQHLSNAEIKNILDKLEEFSYIIVTEHLPNGAFTPNLDLISGQGNRLKIGSGVVITAPPFNFKATKETLLTAVILENGKGIIVTTLYRV